MPAQAADPGGDLPAALRKLIPSGGQLHWLDLDGDLAAALDPAWLSADETARAARFVTCRLRQRYRRAHAFTRARLAAVCGCAPGDLVFRENPWGKPALQAPDGPHFSLSHSEGFALLAISPDQPIGADIEVPRPIPGAELRTLARSIMTTREQSEFARYDDEAAAGQAFLIAWTRKEACVKALGLGLSYPVAQLGTGCNTGETRITMPAVPAGHAVPTVELRSAVLAGGVAVSVAQQI